MGDKSPKAKQRGQDQKNDAKSKTQNAAQAKRQAQAAPAKDKKK